MNKNKCTDIPGISLWKLFQSTNRLVFVAMAFFSLASCSETEGNGTGSEGDELSFTPYLTDRVDAATKGFANTFFEVGDRINVTLTSSQAGATEQGLVYAYGNDGVFRAVGTPYRFPTDDTYIVDLEAVWPDDATEEGSFVADQRDPDAYRRADWLVASATASGIKATEYPVPLHFEHKNCLIEFELVGQSNHTLVISELLIELQIDGDGVACWAFCGNENGRASILLPDHAELKSDAGELIGTIPGTGDTRYSIILPAETIELEAGKKYLVTLTPRGYDLDAFVLIGTFFQADGETEASIGIPFHLPQEGEEGDYIISHPYELITMSYLMRHYLDGSTIQWPSLTYTITDDFEMTQEYAELYKPVPGDLFSGEIIFNGADITSITYPGGVLELFINE